MAGNWDRDEDRGGSNQWREGRERGSSSFDEGPHAEPWGGGDWADSGGGGRGGQSGGTDRGRMQSWNEGNGGGSRRGSEESHYGSEHGFGGFQGDYSGGGGQGGFGGEGDHRGGRQNFSGGGSRSFGQDDHYRSWRARQIEQMDRDYEEYCRDRQQSFHTDFGSWRQNRQAQGGSGAGASASTGSSGTTGLVPGSGETIGGGGEDRAETGSTNSEAISRPKKATS